MLAGADPHERDDVTRAGQGQVTEGVAHGLGAAGEDVGLGGDAIRETHARSTFLGAGGQSSDDVALGEQSQDHGWDGGQETAGGGETEVGGVLSGDLGDRPLREPSDFRRRAASTMAPATGGTVSAVISRSGSSRSSLSRVSTRIRG